MKLALVVALAACGAPQPRPPKQLLVTDVDSSLVAGYVTIVDFWSESCAACVPVAGMVAIAIADQPRVVMRMVDVGDGFTPIAHAYEIGALPHYNVYDRKKRLRYILVGGDCLRAPVLARELLAEP
jgi:hypothetical protein